MTELDGDKWSALGATRLKSRKSSHMFHLECIKDGSKDVNLNGLLARRLRLLYTLAKVLQHLQSVFVCNVWKHQAVESDRTVNYSDAKWQWTRNRLALLIVSKHSDRQFSLALHTCWWFSSLVMFTSTKLLYAEPG